MKLKKLHPKKEPKFDYVALDIETNPDGTVFHICVYDGLRFFHVSRWSDLWSLAVKNQWGKLYAHNGGGFDWLSFAAWAIPETNLPISCMMSGSKLVGLFVETEWGQVGMLDSMNILVGSLDSVSRKLLGEGKLETNKLPHELDKDTLIRYVERDTSLCWRCIRKLHQLIRDEVCELPNLGITAASTAMMIFRCMYDGPQIESIEDERVNDACRKAYAGGRVEVFRPGYHHEMRVYDINSMYPFVMRNNPFPINDRGVWFGDSRYQNRGISVCRIHFKQSGSGPACFTWGGEGKREGEGWYYSPEIENGIANGCEVEVLEGFAFDKTYPIFREYVDCLYGLRMKDKDGPIGYIAKLFLNSLYGKFGMRSERETLVVCRTLDEIDAIEKQGGICKSQKYGIYSVETESHTGYQHVGIAGMVTSRSRALLHSYLDSESIYCDTDSIHTTSTLPTDPRKLGALKLEHEGEGVYAGKKLYALRGTTEKVRVKGVRIGGKFGERLTFDDVVKVSNGEKTLCKFQTFTTPREAITGKQAPCKLHNRQRAISPTY